MSAGLRLTVAPKERPRRMHICSYRNTEAMIDFETKEIAVHEVSILAQAKLKPLTANKVEITLGGRTFMVNLATGEFSVDSYNDVEITNFHEVGLVVVTLKLTGNNSFRDVGAFVINKAVQSISKPFTEKGYTPPLFQERRQEYQH